MIQVTVHRDCLQVNSQVTMKVSEVFIVVVAQRSVLSIHVHFLTTMMSFSAYRHL